MFTGAGAFGYFPTYTLGNIYSAQLFQTFSKENSDFQLEVREKKDFSSLLNWLKKTFIGNYKANIT